MNFLAQILMDFRQTMENNLMPIKTQTYHVYFWRIVLVVFLAFCNGIFDPSVSSSHEQFTQKNITISMVNDYVDSLTALNRNDVNIAFIDCTFEFDSLNRLFSICRVESLGLHHCKLSTQDLKALKKGAELSSMLIANCSLTEQDFANFTPCLKNLQSLSIEDLRFSGDALSLIPYPEKLSFLSLKNTDFSDQKLEILERFSELDCLDISGTKCSADSFLRLPKFKHLANLFCDIKYDPDKWFEVLLKQNVLNQPISRSAQQLDLSNCKFSDTGLCKLNQKITTKWLNLEKTAITDMGLQHLEFAPDLETLVIDGTSIDDNGISSLRTSKKLRDLHCSVCKINGTGLMNLSLVGSLQRLEINGNCLTIQGLKSISQNRQILLLTMKDCKLPNSPGRLNPLARLPLYHLNLSGTHLVQSDQAFFANLHEISSLVLDRNTICPGFLEGLKNSSELKFLSLRKTKGLLNVKSVKALSKLSQLEELWLHDSDISATDRDWLRHELPECKIVI